MQLTRAYVYQDARASRVLMALECSTVTKELAKVPAHISLESLAPGMVFRLVKGRQPMMASTRSIERIDQKKAGQSIITFVTPKPGPADAQPGAAEPKHK